MYNIDIDSMGITKVAFLDEIGPGRSTIRSTKCTLLVHEAGRCSDCIKERNC